MIISINLMYSVSSLALTWILCSLLIPTSQCSRTLDLLENNYPRETKKTALKDHPQQTTLTQDISWSPEHVDAMIFLRQYLPPGDVDLPQSFLEETVSLAIKARRATEWGKVGTTCAGQCALKLSAMTRSLIFPQERSTGLWTEYFVQMIAH
jgi:hypothetical protein